MHRLQHLNKQKETHLKIFLAPPLHTSSEVSSIQKHIIVLHQIMKHFIQLSYCLLKENKIASVMLWLWQLLQMVHSGTWGSAVQQRLVSLEETERVQWCRKTSRAPRDLSQQHSWVNWSGLDLNLDLGLFELSLHRSPQEGFSVMAWCRLLRQMPVPAEHGVTCAQ